MNTNREWLASHISRYRAKLIFIHNNIKIDVDFSFKIPLEASKDQRFVIRHFGDIESLETGQLWNFIDFMDEYFLQKRSTIINYICKCLDIKKPEGGIL